MIRAVYDTNVILSGFFWKGNECECMRKVEKKEVVLLLSKEIVEEIYEVIRKKKLASLIKNVQVNPEELVRKIVSMSEIVNAKMRLDIVLDDPKDSKFIECAVAAKARYIVSGDSHLLKLKRYEEIEILNAKDFLSHLRDT
jgi:putative PIN family toxin of toxin-antitoxin system